jgi:hypothetical protein
MTSVTVSKNLTWFYNINMNHENDIIKLVGFTKNGSIISNRIEFEDYLNISFDLLIYPDAIDNAAILDIDCHDNIKDNLRWFSVIIKNKQIRLIAKELNDRKLIGILDYNKDWINVIVKISSNCLNISMGENEISHAFKDQLRICSVSFGNNYPKEVDHIYSLAVKNIKASTENGVYPLIIKDVAINEAW